LVAASLQGLTEEESKALLANPKQYLSTLPPQQASIIRDILMPGYRRAFQVIFLVGAGLAVLAFFVAFFLMPHIQLSRPDDEKLKEEARQDAKKQEPGS